MAKTGFILGGALQGIGAGLVQQGQVNAENARASATQRFQDYLAQRKTQADDARATQQHGWDIERDNNQAALRATQAEADAKNTAVRDGTQQKYAVQMEGLKASNQAKIEGLKSTLSMTEYERKAALDLANDVSRSGQEIGHTEVAADGRMIIYSKSGEVLRASPPGTFNPRAAAADDGDLLGSRGAPTATPAPRAPAPRPAAPAPAPARQPLVKRPSLDDIFAGQPGSPASTLNSTFQR